MIPNYTPMHQLLLDNGYSDGWAMSEETLLVWEHEEEPPTPLVRPQTLEPVVVEPVLDESTDPPLTEETEENTETTDDQTTV